ncbi:MAG: hypothetical protein CMI56_02195 [Parcubacteria group bacterium]|nr:hypothetical protein [Parcubacteria group bacterium]|tara:strand:+ start:4846 stop:5106 length:261 start_codon:yes stop_codon:yes gene_type:complete
MEEKLKNVRKLLEADSVIPTAVGTNLQIAVNSLFKANAQLLALDDSEICALMEEHLGVREILEDSAPEEIAWALRLANEARTAAKK